MMQQQQQPSDAEVNAQFSQVARAQFTSKVAEIITNMRNIPQKEQVEWMAASLTTSEKMQIVRMYSDDSCSPDKRLKGTADILTRILELPQ